MVDSLKRSECRISKAYLGGYCLEYVEYRNSVWPEIVEKIAFNESINMLKQHHKIYCNHLPKINPLINDR